ncbi:MAG TPA: hypothetical protein VMT04_05745 [Terriglobales bacterium]|nr:hypothetical protein [Terriglobales bacterium]
MKGIIERLIIGGVTLVLIFFFYSGCKKSTSPTDNLDQEAINRLISSDSYSFPQNIISSDSTSYPKLAVVDTIKFWWRKINRVNRNIYANVYKADSTHLYPYAYATVIDTLYGQLFVLAEESSQSMTKLITDVAVKHAYFEEREGIETAYRGWRLIAVSGQLIHSFPTDTRIIDSVKVVAPGKNLILTESDITDTTSRGNILTFTAGDSVTLTVFTRDLGDNTDSVFLHSLPCHYYNCKPHRRSFHDNGDGSFTGTWMVGNGMMDSVNVAIRHAAIDVIKHSSLDGTSSDPYDSRIWGFIYRVNAP